MAMKEVLVPTTSAVTSTAFECNGRNPLTVICAGLAGGETADVQIDLNGVWTPLIRDKNDSGFTASINFIVFNTPGKFRVDKSASVATVGVYVGTNLAH